MDNDIDGIDPDLFILNEHNVHITADYIEEVLKKYGVDHKVQNLKEFQTAMTHVSYLVRDETNQKAQKMAKHAFDLEPIDDPTKAIPLQQESYERLEFLGDSVIHHVLAKYLFARYEKQNEGFLTKLRTKIESGETLALISTAIGLNKYILISRYIEKNGGRENNAHILEDSFEAFMGAFSLETGFESCYKFMVILMEQEMDFGQILNTETNFKDRLLQYFHQQKWQDPYYGVLDTSGPEYKKNFTIYVKRRLTKTDDGEVLAHGVGPSKKKGEQDAARQALIRLKLINDNESDSETLEEYISSSEAEELEELIESDEPDTKPAAAAAPKVTKNHK